jgi:hypothetical protein
VLLLLMEELNWEAPEGHDVWAGLGNVTLEHGPSHTTEACLANFDDSETMRRRRLESWD